MECSVLKLYIIGSTYLWTLLEIFIYEKESIKKNLGLVGKVTGLFIHAREVFLFCCCCFVFSCFFSLQPWFWMMICSTWIQLHTKYASSWRRTKRRLRLFWKPDDKGIYRPATDSYYRLHGHHWRGRKVNLGRKPAIEWMALMPIHRHEASVGKMTWSNMTCESLLNGKKQPTQHHLFNGTVPKSVWNAACLLLWKKFHAYTRLLI